MNEFLEKLVARASSGVEYGKVLTESGVKSVREMVGKVNLFGALAANSTKEVEFDETHYVLVPMLGEGGHAVYTKRVLPEGVGGENDLPKRRVFHVPSLKGQDIIEQELVRQLMGERFDPHQAGSDFADRMDEVADRIDRETARISGGLILIGGVVAVANPLLGVGIAAKALFPSVTGVVTKSGMGYLSGKIRGFRKRSHESTLEKVAKKEVKRLKPEIFENGILHLLAEVVTGTDSKIDPALDRRAWVDSFESVYLYDLTLEAIREVYEEGELDEIVNESHREWVRRLLERSGVEF